MLANFDANDLMRIKYCRRASLRRINFASFMMQVPTTHSAPTHMILKVKHPWAMGTDSVL